MPLNASKLGDYTHPQYDRDAGLLFNVVYYGVAIPVSYVGNLFTYIIVCKLLRYRDSTSDVLVGGLALNDVLTAIIVFTPSLISAARGRYFNSKAMCEFSAVTTVWYIYTTFAMLVLISGDRWLAITKPFIYKRLLLTGFKLKAIMGVLGFFCLMMASIPLLRYPVVLKAGWYCAPVHITYIPLPSYTATTTTTTTTNNDNINNNNSNNVDSSNIPISAFNTTNSTINLTFAARIDSVSNKNNSITKTTETIQNNDSIIATGGVSAGRLAEMSPVQETIYIKLIYLVLGIFTLVACNVSIAFTLKRRPFGDAASREVDRKFARIMGVVACLFLFTWLPNLTAQAACLAKSPVCPEFEFWAMRIVNVGVAVNPFVYGVMKTTYRRGYLYLARVTLHYLTCTLLPLPTYGEEIFDLRDRVRATSISINSSNSQHKRSSSTSSRQASNGNMATKSLEHPQRVGKPPSNTDPSDSQETTKATTSHSKLIISARNGKQPAGINRALPKNEIKHVFHADPGLTITMDKKEEEDLCRGGSDTRYRDEPDHITADHYCENDSARSTCHGVTLVKTEEIVASRMSPSLTSSVTSPPPVSRETELVYVTSTRRVNVMEVSSPSV